MLNYQYLLQNRVINTIKQNCSQFLNMNYFLNIEKTGKKIVKFIFQMAVPIFELIPGALESNLSKKFLSNIFVLRSS